MKSNVVLGIALAAGMALPTLAIAQEAARPPVVHHHFHHHVHHHVAPHVEAQAAQPDPVQASVPHPAPAPSVFPAIAPYPDNKCDEDGLSDNVNDCNKGCVDGNTN